MSIISASCCIYEKRWESEEISCIYVSGFEELVSQNTYFGICIFCTSAVLFLVWLSHGGNGLLWHWIYSFQFRFIHFVSFRKIQKYTRLKIGQNTLTWSSSLSIIWVSSKSGSSIDTSSKTESSENDCNWAAGHWVVKLLTDSSTTLTNCTSLPCECHVYARQ